jgi:hypothetical protein
MTSNTAPTVAGDEFLLIWNAMVASPPALVQQPKRPEDNGGDDSHPQPVSSLEEA